MWFLFPVGLLFGLLGGPFILHLLCSLVARFRYDKVRKEMDLLRKEHNRAVKKMQREYESMSRDFNKKIIEIQRILDSGKKKEEVG